MPLCAELDDGKRWLVCAARARVRVKLRWSELPHPSLERDRVILCRYWTSSWLGLRLHRGEGLLGRGEDEEEWTAAVIVQAGWFLSRRLHFEVDGSYDPPRKAGVRLVPKASAAVALVVLVSALIAFALRTASVLATLHLEVSYASALTGLGGVTIVALASKALRTVTRDLQIHGIPFYGLGYVLGRTLVFVAAVACTLGVVIPTCMTTVVNETEANIELKLPSSPGRLVLGPDQEVTFLGRAQLVGTTVRSSFTEEERFCVVGPYGQGLKCDPDAPLPELPGAGSLEQQLFVPTKMRVSCRARIYRALRAEGSSMELLSNVLPDVQSLQLGPIAPTTVVELDARCQPKSPGRAVVKAWAGAGFDARYELTEPRTFAEVERSSRLVVQRRSVGLDEWAVCRQSLKNGSSGRCVVSWDELGLRVVGPETPGAEGTPPVPGAVLRLAALPNPVEVTQASSNPVFGPISEPIHLPHGAGVDELTVIVSRGGASEQSSVSCAREQTDAEGYFRLVELYHSSTDASGIGARLLEVSGRSTAVPAWSSRWQDLRPGQSANAPMLLCMAAAPTSSVEGKSTGSQPASLRSSAQSLVLRLGVAFPRAEEGLVLRLPAEHAARRIEVSAQTDAGTVARGTLTCVLPKLAAGSEYELRPVWVVDDRNRRLRRVRELELGQADSVEQSTNEGRYYSHWVTELDEAAGGHDGWFPPWVCRPTGSEPPPCGRGSGSELDVEVETTRSWKAKLCAGPKAWRATLDPVRPKPCYFDGETHAKRRSCPARCRTKLSRDDRDEYNRNYGLSCQVTYECKARGDGC